MISELDENGQLPPGIHQGTLAEVIERFGSGSEEREACAQSLRWLLPMCRRAGIQRLILNGSFVTDRLRPGDVDCVLVPGPQFERNSDAAMAIQIGLPFLSLQIIASEEEFEFFIRVAFATDRLGRAKGLVEVAL